MRDRLLKTGLPSVWPIKRKMVAKALIIAWDILENNKCWKKECLKLKLIQSREVSPSIYLPSSSFFPHSQKAQTVYIGQPCFTKQDGDASRRHNWSAAINVISLLFLLSSSLVTLFPVLLLVLWQLNPLLFSLFFVGRIKSHFCLPTTVFNAPLKHSVWPYGVTVPFSAAARPCATRNLTSCETSASLPPPLSENARWAQMHVSINSFSSYISFTPSFLVHQYWLCKHEITGSPWSYATKIWSPLTMGGTAYLDFKTPSQTNRKKDVFLFQHHMLCNFSPHLKSQGSIPCYLRPQPKTPYIQMSSDNTSQKSQGWRKLGGSSPTTSERVHYATPFFYMECRPLWHTVQKISQAPLVIYGSNNTIMKN